MNKVKILVVDDDANLLKLVAMWLSKEGYAVTCVQGVSIEEKLVAFGSAFQGVIEPSTFAVAIVDGDLGPKSAAGWQLVPFLRSAGVICIACTSREDYEEKLMEAGCWSKANKVQILDSIPPLVAAAIAQTTKVA